MKVNKYVHLTNTQIDRFLAMSKEEYNAEVDRFIAEIHYNNFPTSAIERNRQFILPVPFSKIYIRRGNKFFIVTDNGDTEVLESEVPQTISFLYRDNNHELHERLCLQKFKNEELSGGSPYCKHTLGHTECVTCGAVRKHPYVSGSIVKVRD